MSPRPPVFGPTIDDETRCVHYGTALDVVAIRFHCCGRYYPCHLCHAEGAGHPSTLWPVASRGERAILCGACGLELTIAEYLEVAGCPGCGAEFNPGCRSHAHYYFSEE